MPKAVIMKQVEGKPGKVYYPPHTHPRPQRPHSNHPRRRPQPPRLLPAPTPLPRALLLHPHLADGCGVVTSTGSSANAKSWLNKRVILNPGSGWKDDPAGPEAPTGYAILGGTSTNPLGTLQEVVCVDANEAELAPEHLSSVQAAALPLTGLTGWRALISKSGNAEAGRNILVTGIGGGVALNVLQYANALGANVYVTSGSQEKIDRAVKEGAKG
ncbi:putative zinc-type alcohol dehydrogenase-like protein, partial [Lachnellula suecica]